MSPDLIQVMMERASNDMYWLSGEELSSLGIEAPWYQEMRVALCGADYARERQASLEYQRWAASGFDGPAPTATLVTGNPKCGVEIAKSAQAKFRATEKKGGSSTGVRARQR